MSAIGRLEIAVLVGWLFGWGACAGWIVVRKEAADARLAALCFPSPEAPGDPCPPALSWEPWSVCLPIVYDAEAMTWTAGYPLSWAPDALVTAPNDRWIP